MRAAGQSAMPRSPSAGCEARSASDSSSQLNSPAPQPPQIPDHELVCLIGRGSYGEVWLARNAIGGLRAVKIVRRESFQHADHFEREFKGLLKFEPISRSHDGLVDILQIGRRDDAGYFYYVMELADAAEPRGASIQCSVSQYSVSRVPSAVPVTASQLNTGSLNTEYFPRTLRSELVAQSRLPPAECVVLGLKLAAALEHLHAHGLVHRDIKPSNIIFVAGEPKLADIGLVTAIDEAHSLVGTVGYIPPEGPGTPQADLYSLGKVLYEIAFGKDRQEFPQLPADLHSHPDYAALIELNEIILKACETDPHRRYASAAALGEDLARLQQGRSVKRRHTVERRWGFVKKYGLAAAAVSLLVAGAWWLSRQFHDAKVQPAGNSSSPAAPATATQFIAVLPFDNESPDKADEYLGSSIADELSGALTRIPELRILGRDSAAALKSSKDRRAVAQQLKVGTVLVGHLRKSASQLRLTAQLINADDDSLLWSEVYDRDMREIFGIQTDIAEQVADRLNVKLSDGARARLAHKPTKDLEAYQLYLEGRYFWNTRTARGVASAIEYFKKAIQKDPSYAQAYAGLTDCYSSWEMAVSDLGIGINVRENAEKAVLLGPNVGEAHASLGFILEASGDWKGAETAFKRALELDPNNATVHSWYGIHLARMGQYEAGIFEARLAQELDPLSSLRSWVLCWVLTAARQYDAAIEQFENNLRLPPSQPQRQRVGDCYFYKGLYEEGIAAFRKAAISNGQDPQQVAERYDSLRQAYLKFIRRQDYRKNEDAKYKLAKTVGWDHARPHREGVPLNRHWSGQAFAVRPYASGGFVRFYFLFKCFGMKARLNNSLQRTRRLRLVASRTSQAARR